MVYPSDKPETSSSWKEAKAEVAAKVKEAISLLEDLERHGTWPGCWMQLPKVFKAVTQSAYKLAKVEAESGPE